MKFPETDTLALELRDEILFVTLDRPRRKNAMNRKMVAELSGVLDALDGEVEVRAIVLRGAGGDFCAGGDVKEMARSASSAELAEHNRAFGRLATRVNAAGVVVVVALEGAVLGGGFGLACVSDVALALRDAQFGLPETGLGLIPAQIAPFVVQRIGLTQARRLALTGARFDGAEAYRMGLVHRLCADAGELADALDDVLRAVRRCAPGANATTKRLLFRALTDDLERVLEGAARDFAQAVLGPEGREGTAAFAEKRRPSWAER